MLAWDSWGDTLRKPELLWPDLITRRTIAALGLAALTSLIPDHVWQRWGWDDPLAGTVRGAALRVVLAAVFLLLASAALANQGYNPFIYYRF